MECDSLMIAELDVKTLSRTDKLRLLESLWADLSAECLHHVSRVAWGRAQGSREASRGGQRPFLGLGRGQMGIVIIDDGEHQSGE